jgi:hypothetical protein
MSCRRQHDRTRTLTAVGRCRIVVDDGQIRREEVHDHSIDLWLQRLPVNIVVLLADGDEVTAQEHRLDALNAKQLSGVAGRQHEHKRKSSTLSRSRARSRFTWPMVTKRLIECSESLACPVQCRARDGPARTSDYSGSVFLAIE